MPRAAKDSPYLTTGERVRNFLGWAFVISILGHVILGPLVPFKQSHADEQQVEKVSLVKKVKVKVPTPPPPTPTPKPTVPPKSTPPPKPVPHQVQPQLKVNLVHQKSSSNNSTTSQSYVAPKTGSQNGVPSGQATAAPAGAGTPAAKAAATPKPACPDPYREATMTNGVAPEYPEAAKQQGLGAVTVLVRITLSPGASVMNASILQSSGNMSIDQSAMVAARQSSYAPKLVNCQPVEGTYSFRASFDPSQ